MEMVRAYILVLFLILGRKLSVILWVFRRSPLSGRSSLPFLVCWMFIMKGCWILPNALSASNKTVMWFLSYLDWFWYVEPTLYSCDKSHLVMVYNPFYMLLGLVYWKFVEEFCICIGKRYWSIVFFFCGGCLALESRTHWMN